MSSEPSRRGGLYLRISDDREGEGLGVERQRKDCERLARQRGVPIVAPPYIDNGISAYNGKRRPAYERLLADIRAGAIDVVIAWHPDRLTRRPLDLEEFIALVEERGVEVFTVTAGDIDLSTPTGRAVGRTVAAWARQESEHKAERIRRKHQEIAERGLWSGNGRRPFGFRNDRAAKNLIVVPEEAAMIREAADRVLAGDSISGIITDWNRRGLRTVTGSPWSREVLRHTLTSGRVAGLRYLGQWERRGGRSRKVGERLMADAKWPAILTREQHEQLRAVLRDPARRLTPGPARRYLLSGIAKCGRCGRGLAGRPHRDGRPRLVCPGPPTGSGCNGTTIMADPADAEVVAQVLSTVSGPDFAAAMREQALASAPAPLLADLRRIEAKQEELAHAYAADAIGMREWITARDHLEADAADLRRRIGEGTRSPILHSTAGMSRKQLERHWDGLDLSGRRAFLQAFVSEVVINRARPGYNRFDPARIEVRWLV
jgi:DNA invertase Pin-like site-specific DNA recombinase